MAHLDEALSNLSDEFEFDDIVEDYEEEIELWITYGGD